MIKFKFKIRVTYSHGETLEDVTAGDSVQAFGEVVKLLKVKQKRFGCGVVESIKVVDRYEVTSE